MAKPQMELDQEDLNEISRLIQNGITGGRLDSEDEQGNGVFISWELKTEKWKD